MTRIKSINILFPLFVLAVYSIFFKQQTADYESISMIFIAFLMAYWWLTEAIPLAVTALIPFIFFPLYNICSSKEIAPLYMNHIIFLFIGGFILSFAIEKWNLHKRIALKTLSFFGFKPLNILLGFMLATFFLSMWISNIAATMMMIPTALAVLNELSFYFPDNQKKSFQSFLLMSIGYSSSIGGTATLIGTAPNLILLSIYEHSFNQHPELNFGLWMLITIPSAILILFILFLLLKFIFLKDLTSFKQNLTIDNLYFKKEYEKLGAFSFEEKIVGLLFITTALLWITRSDINIGEFSFYGWKNIFPNSDYITDGTVAVFFASLLFFIPSKNKKVFLMDWNTAKNIPYEIILLFGGGFALAFGFEKSGLSQLIGNQIVFLDNFPPFVLVLILCFIMTFLTEFTSNTATTQLILPIIVSFSMNLDINPLLILVPVTVSASYAFMLPIATPPNLIAFGTNKVNSNEMLKLGLLLNLIGVFTVSITIYLIVNILF